MVRERDARVDEIDGAVAVAILKHDARLEEVAERRRRGVGATDAAGAQREQNNQNHPFHGIRIGT